MRRETVAEPGGPADAGETGEHKRQDGGAAVQAKSAQQGNGTEGGDGQREGAMGAFFARDEMRDYGGEREQKRGREAVKHAEQRCGGAEGVG